MKSSSPPRPGSFQHLDLASCTRLLLFVWPVFFSVSLEKIYSSYYAVVVLLAEKKALHSISSPSSLISSNFTAIVQVFPFFSVGQCEGNDNKTDKMRAFFLFIYRLMCNEHVGSGESFRQGRRRKMINPLCLLTFRSILCHM